MPCAGGAVGWYMTGTGAGANDNAFVLRGLLFFNLLFLLLRDTQCGADPTRFVPVSTAADPTPLASELLAAAADDRGRRGARGVCAGESEDTYTPRTSCA